MKKNFWPILKKVNEDNEKQAKKKHSRKNIFYLSK